MFGALRLFFSLLVVYTHLAAGGFIGGRAVFGFYLLSGYLMTLVLQERYLFRPGPYFLNRALRLYPDYWLVAGLTLIIIIKIPEAQSFHSAYQLRNGIIDYLGNLLIFPFVVYKNGLRLVPPTWSVAIEMVHYFLLWLVVARRKGFALLALAVGAGFHAWSLANGEPPYARYYSVFASLLPFALGATLYFYSPQVQALDRKKACAIGVAGFLTFVVTGTMLYLPNVSPFVFNASVYVNLLGVLGMVAALSQFPVPKWDEWCGQLAYPVFLVHWLVGFLVSHFLNIPRGGRLYCVSLPIALVTAGVLAYSTRLVIDPMRSSVRRLVRAK